MSYKHFTVEEKIPAINYYLKGNLFEKPKADRLAYKIVTCFNGAKTNFGVARKRRRRKIKTERAKGFC